LDSFGLLIEADLHLAETEVADRKVGLELRHAMHLCGGFPISAQRSIRTAQNVVYQWALWIHFDRLTAFGQPFFAPMHGNQHAAQIKMGR
jgi:hypothetical protein